MNGDNPRSQLAEKRGGLLTKIKEAAQEGKTREVLSMTEKLRKIEILVVREEKLRSDISELDIESPDLPSPDFHSMERNVDKIVENPNRGGEMSRKAIAQATTNAFVKKMSKDGIVLRWIKYKIYKTESGYKVGIATANEKENRKNWWWLGLKDKSFDVAVLLCRPIKGETIGICLPNSFFLKYGESLSRSRQGDIKINVFQREHGYVVQVPKIGAINIDRFIGDYSPLTI